MQNLGTEDLVVDLYQDSRNVTALCNTPFFLMLNAKIKCKRCKIDTKLLATFDEIEGLEKIPADQTKEYQFLSRVNTI